MNWGEIPFDPTAVISYRDGSGNFRRISRLQFIAQSRGRLLKDHVVTEEKEPVDD